MSRRANISPTRIDLVKSTWQRVPQIQATAAELFYGRRFELAPDTRGLCKRDIHVQGAMLMSALDRGAQPARPGRCVAHGRATGVPPSAMSPAPCKPNTTTAWATRASGRWNKVWVLADGALVGAMKSATDSATALATAPSLHGVSAFATRRRPWSSDPTLTVTSDTPS